MNQYLYLRPRHAGKQHGARGQPLLYHGIGAACLGHEPDEANALSMRSGSTARCPGSASARGRTAHGAHRRDGRGGQRAVRCSGARPRHFAQDRLSSSTRSRPNREVLRNRIFSGEALMTIWYGIENGIPTADMEPRSLPRRTSRPAAMADMGTILRDQGRRPARRPTIRPLPSCSSCSTTGTCQRHLRSGPTSGGRCSVSMRRACYHGRPHCQCPAADCHSDHHGNVPEDGDLQLASAWPDRHLPTGYVLVRRLATVVSACAAKGCSRWRPTRAASRRCRSRQVPLAMRTTNSAGELKLELAPGSSAATSSCSL